MATTTHLTTVEEFSRLPETEPFYYELHHGELVPVTRPKFKHFRLRRRLRTLLEKAAGPARVVDTELAFRALPEHDLRIADVAYISAERWTQVDPDDYLRTAPDLVIEVLSPSNTAAELNEKEKLCLENGCSSFWIVDPALRHVKVATPDGITTTYQAGQQIPLHLFETTLAVDAIFVAN